MMYHASSFESTSRRLSQSLLARSVVSSRL